MISPVTGSWSGSIIVSAGGVVVSAAATSLVPTTTRPAVRLAVLRSSHRRLTLPLVAALSMLSSMVLTSLVLSGRGPADDDLAALHRLHTDGVEARQFAVESEGEDAHGYLQPVVHFLFR